MSVMCGKKYISIGTNNEKKMLGPKGFSIVAFCILAIIVIFARPSFLVNEETGRWKEFGVGSGKTCVNITVVIILIALCAYLVSTCIGTTIDKWKGKGGGAIVPEIVQRAPTPAAPTPTTPTPAAPTPTTPTPAAPTQVLAPFPQRIAFPTFGFF